MADRRMQQTTAESAASAGTQLAVGVFGALSLRRDGVPVDTARWPRPALRLLRLLAVSPDRRMRREPLIETIWPESGADAGASNLRHNLYVVRREMGLPLVLADRDWVLLNPAYTWTVDLEEFERRAEEAGEDCARLEGAARLYRNEVLVEDEYEEWAAPIRERAHRIWRDISLRIASIHLAGGRAAEALIWYEALLAQDPLDEDAVRGALEALAALDRRTQALRLYRAFAERLWTEIEVTPGPETEAAVARLKAAPAPAELSQGQPVPAVEDPAPPMRPAELSLSVPWMISRLQIPIRLALLPAAVLVVVVLVAVSALRGSSHHASPQPSTQSADTHTPLAVLGGPFVHHLSLLYPTGIAAGADGNLYVSDRGCNPDLDPQCVTPVGSIWRLFGSGTERALWARPFAVPNGMSRDARGNLYTVDTVNDNVIELSPGGHTLMHWGKAGSVAGSFNSPNRLAVASNGDVYVSDSGNSRIQKLSPQGRVLADWGSAGSGRRQLTTPSGIAVTGGTVYVADTGNNRIARFSSSGAWLDPWGGRGEAPGQMRDPLDIAAGPDGDLYVADTGNSRIQVFSPAGQVLAVWTLPDAPRALTLDGHGDVFVLSATVRRIEELSPAGLPLQAWMAASPPRPILISPAGAARIGGSRIAVADARANRIDVFSDSGTLVARWEGASVRLLHPHGVAADAAGDIFVADTGNNRVVELSSHGRVKRAWSSVITGNGPPPLGQPTTLSSPTGIAVDGRSHVFVADTGNNVVQEFTADGRYLATWGHPGIGADPGGLFHPQGIAVDRAGDVYVADTDYNRVQEFGPDRHLLTYWGGVGGGNGKLRMPASIAIAANGDVLVADAGNHRIDVFSPTGTSLGHWGRAGTVPGAFVDPVAITVDRAGRLLVADAGSGRVQLFSGG